MSRRRMSRPELRLLPTTRLTAIFVREEEGKKERSFERRGYDCFELDYGKKNSQGYMFCENKENAFC